MANYKNQIRRCIDCNIPIINRLSTAIRCRECSTKRRRIKLNEYAKKPEAIIKRRKYNKKRYKRLKRRRG